MILTYIIIAITFVVSYQGFKDFSFFEKYKFNVDGILIDKQYFRIITSGFLHGSWGHFGMNMLTLYFFGNALEKSYGIENFFLIYFGSMILGSLLALFVHRNHGDYSAIGASGAVSGAILAFVVLYPNVDLYLFFVLPLKAWLFAVLYILGSIYGTRSQVGNIGHDAHLGGAVGGTVLAVLVKPGILTHNWWIVLLVLVPTIIFLLLMIYRPEMMLIDNYFGKQARDIGNRSKRSLKIVGKRERKDPEKELDELLDKINQSGYDSLSEHEKKRLQDLSDH